MPIISSVETYNDFICVLTMVHWENPAELCDAVKFSRMIKVETQINSLYVSNDKFMDKQQFWCGNCLKQ